MIFINNNDFFIYGEIETWDSVTAATLSTLNTDTTVHINSQGGDIFTAITIHNALKNLPFKKNCVIEGVCASAAVIIACACDKITICNNALMMIHDPIAELCNQYSPDDLNKVKNSLDKVKSSICQILMNRTGKTEAEISRLMADETWFNADEAVANKFADEVFGNVEMALQGDTLISNNLRISCGNFKNLGKLQFKNVDLRANETERIKLLNSKRGYNFLSDKLIDTAIEQGDDYASLEKYFNVVKKYTPLMNLCIDNKNSGAEGVLGNVTDTADKNKVRAQAIAKFAS